MTNLDEDLSRRYAQAFEQYSNLTQAFLRQTDDLTGTLSRWFQRSIVGDRADLAEHWNRFAATLGLQAAAQPAAPSAMDALLARHALISTQMSARAADCQRLQAQLAQHWAGVGESAAQRFAAQFQAPSPEAGADWARQAYAQWIDAAETAYAQAAHTSEYAVLIAGLSNAAHAFKAAQADLMELWARQFNQPTRSEIDALNLQIKELREQVRNLRERFDA